MLDSAEKRRKRRDALGFGVERHLARRDKAEVDANLKREARSHGLRKLDIAYVIDS